MRSVFEIAKETTPADTYDALKSILGAGAQRVINGLDYVGGEQFFGRAVTLRSLPARPDYIAEVEKKFKDEHGVADPLSHVISLCDEESVLVVDSSGYNHSAIAGGTKMASLAARKAAGFVTDGALRDKSEFARYASQYGMKTSCSDWTVQSGTKSALYGSDVNAPVTVHGVLVRPGDYIFGDENAILVIPEAKAEEILETGVLHSRLNDFVTKKLEETGGIMGKDVLPKSPEMVKELLADAEYSERQIELFKEHIGEVA